MTYYIDPGTSKGCAVACFGSSFTPGGRVLTGLGIWSDRNGLEAHWGIFAGSGAVWEKPQLYPNARREKPGVMVAKANDLIDLADAGSACANVLGWGRGGVRSIKPAAWKKQLSKPIHHKAAWGVLVPDERALIVSAQKDLGRVKGDPWVHLVNYIDAGCEAVARKKDPAYSAKITDLLDAVCLGLSQEGRLVL